MNGAAWSCVVSPLRFHRHDLKHKSCLMVSNTASNDFQMLGNKHLFISHGPWHLFYSMLLASDLESASTLHETSTLDEISLEMRCGSKTLPCLHHAQTKGNGWRIYISNGTSGCILW